MAVGTSSTKRCREENMEPKDEVGLREPATGYCLCCEARVRDVEQKSKLIGTQNYLPTLKRKAPNYTVDIERYIHILLSRAFSSSCSCCRLGDKSQKPGLKV